MMDIAELYNDERTFEEGQIVRYVLGHSNGKPVEALHDHVFVREAAEMVDKATGAFHRRAVVRSTSDHDTPGEHEVWLTRIYAKEEETADA